MPLILNVEAKAAPRGTRARRAACQDVGVNTGKGSDAFSAGAGAGAGGGDNPAGGSGFGAGEPAEAAGAQAGAQAEAGGAQAGEGGYSRYEAVGPKEDALVTEIKQVIGDRPVQDVARSVSSGAWQAVMNNLPSPLARLRSGAMTLQERVRAIFWGAVAFFLFLLVVFSTKPDAFSDLFGRFPASLTFPFAQLIALRSVVAIGFALLTLVYLVMALWRTFTTRTGRYLWIVTLIFALGVGLHVSSVRSAGINTGARVGPDLGWSLTRQGGAVTVLVANLDGRVTLASDVALLAEQAGADVIVLPESSAEMAAQVANDLTKLHMAHLPSDALPVFDEAVFQDPAVIKPTGAFTVYAAAGSDLLVDGVKPQPGVPPRRGATTTVLVSTALGPYRLERELGTANGSVLLAPVTQGAPTIAAVHGASPKRDSMVQWRADLEKVTSLCSDRTRTGLIVAGTLNSTRDHALVRSSQCGLAMHQLGQGSVGTWPVGVPALLGAPIDGALIGPGVTPVAAEVLNLEYTDHRAVLMRFELK